MDFVSWDFHCLSSCNPHTYYPFQQFSCFTTPAFPEYLCTLLNITCIQSFTCYPKTETGSVTEKITWYVLVLSSPEVLSLDKEVLNNKIDLWLVWQC